jgi:hypothetical protein
VAQLKAAACSRACVAPFLFLDGSCSMQTALSSASCSMHPAVLSNKQQKGPHILIATNMYLVTHRHLHRLGRCTWLTRCEQAAMQQ